MCDKELFYELCEKYNVKLRDDIDKPKIVIDGEEKGLDKETVINIFNNGLEKCVLK